MEQIREAIKRAKSRQISPRSPAMALSSEAISPAPSPAVHSDDPIAIHSVSARILEQNRIVAHQADHPLSAPFDILRTRLLQEMDKQDLRVVAITSPTPACGKTVTAINLALSVSRLPDRSVVLLDLDLRKPTVMRDLGVRHEKDLSAYLAGDAAFSDILFHLETMGPQLYVIGNERPTPNPAEALSSQRMAELFSAIRNLPSTPIVIVDTPPILVSDDVLVLLPLTDCSLLIVAESASTTREIERAEELLANSNFLGCVLNKSNEPHSTYYY